MALSKLFLLVCIVSIAILIPMAAGAVDLFKPIDHFCSAFSDNFNFTIGSQYEKNLDLVLYNISISMNPQTGFAYGSAGKEANIDPVYGVAQCRGDVSPADCRACVAKIVRWSRQKCPVQKSAYVWFQGCLLRYSDIDLYGKVYDGYAFVFHENKQNLSGVVSVEKLNETFVELSEKAYASENMFAKGVVKLSESKNLYGFVQCTRDASPQVCKTCLGRLIKGIPDVYGVGTQFFQSVCTLQYMFSPFFEA